MEDVTVCRCCLTSGLHKNLYSPHNWLDTREVYSIMLQECFNISLFQYEDASSNTICDACIAALRSSLQFKTKVIKADREFLKTINKLKDKVPDDVAIKQEPETGDGYDSDDIFLADTVSEPTIEHIKVEPNYRAKKSGAKMKCKKKSSLQESKSRSNMKSLVSRLAGATSINLKSEGRSIKQESKNNNLLSLLSIGNVSVRRKTNKHLIDDIKTARYSTKRKIVIKNESSRPKINLLWKKSFDKIKHKENLQTVLKYSNAVPFKTKSLLGYVCAMCNNSYMDPKDLRTHTFAEHAEERRKYDKGMDEKCLSIKLDITDLTCNICNETIENLTIFKTHLVEAHKKHIHHDIKDIILQFKLKKGDVYDCSLCTSTYETFKMLLQHMNIHNTNYPCTVCDASFTTQRSLSAHKKVHTTGSFKCDHCDNVYISNAKKLYHERTKHFGGRSKSKCPYCEEIFQSYYQRNIHLIRVHNCDSQYKCNVCDRSFVLKSLLMYHIKKNHLMERNHQCSQCGYKFFNTKALKAHMVKHTGEKNYLCEVCHKAYARKYTLREHMRIHNNDRRFKCDVCALTFVQKCSLKNHLLTNHGISMAASEIKTIDE